MGGFATFAFFAYLGGSSPVFIQGFGLAPSQYAMIFGANSLGVVRWVRTYSEARPDELVSLFSSDGFFEVAAVNGSAARRLNVEVGSAVELEWD